MSDSSFTFQPDIAPRLPQKRDYGIGLIGAGGVVQYGHMPAYRKAGFNVVGIASRARKRWGAWPRIGAFPGNTPIGANCSICRGADCRYLVPAG